MNYWKIASWNINLPQKTMNIDLVPYISKEFKSLGYEPVYDELRKIRITGAGYTDNFSPNALELATLDIYKLMYNYIKTNVPEFSETIDV